MPRLALARLSHRSAGHRAVMGLWVLTGLALSAARADVVHLANGNEIQGEIIAEDDQQLVVRFPGGTLRLKRKDVHRVCRQPRPLYLLEEAEKALLRKDFPVAIRLFEEAGRMEPGSERARRGVRRARREKANFLRDLCRYEEALELYQRLLRGSPQDSDLAEEIELIRYAWQQVGVEENRAAEELRRGDFETATWRLQKLYDTFPDRRQTLGAALASALIAEGHSHFTARRFKEAGECYRSALVTAPEMVDQVKKRFVRCQVRQIRPLLGSGSYSDAEEVARRALEVTPSSDVLYYFLALTLDAQEKDADAAQLYATLLGKRPPRRPSREVEDLRSEAEAIVFHREEDEGGGQPKPAVPGPFRKLNSSHFVVHHRNPALARRVSVLAERTYSKLFGELGLKTHWQNRCEIFLYPSRAAYEAAVGGQVRTGAVHELERRLGPFSAHRIHSHEGQPRLTEGVLQDEIAHALLIHRLNYPPKIPLWASEGFAVHSEPAYVHSHYRRVVLGGKKRRALIPVAKLLKCHTYPETASIDLFYGESFLVVDYLLRKKGLDKFVGFLKDISQSSLTLEKALARHYGLRSLLALRNRVLGSLN